MASVPRPDPVLLRLRILLLAMEYEAFAKCVCRLLEALGYQQAHPAGRTGRKGYNRPGGGGWDIEATLPGGLVPRRVVAQLKQFDGPTVHQRNIDELRGACLRAKATEALMVTTSSFSEVVRKAALSPDSTGGVVAPVRLIGGEELLALMVRYRVGVRRRGLCPKRHSQTHGSEIGSLLTEGLEVDETFFRSLLGSVATTTPLHEPPTPPGWRVTVQIFSRPFPRAGRGQSMKGEI